MGYFGEKGRGSGVVLSATNVRGFAGCSNWKEDLISMGDD